MLLVWWSTIGVIHHVILRRGETLTADRYSIEMHLRLDFRQPEMVSTHDEFMLHHSTRHIEQKRVQFFSELQYETFPLQHGCPDLYPIITTFLRHVNRFLAQQKLAHREL